MALAVALPARTVAQGNPITSVHQISQKDLGDWMEWIEFSGGSGVSYFEDTVADLAALSPTANDIALVLDDGTDSGFYYYTGSVWSKTADLPPGFEALNLTPADIGAATVAQGIIAEECDWVRQPLRIPRNPRDISFAIVNDGYVFAADESGLPDSDELIAANELIDKVGLAEQLRIPRGPLGAVRAVASANGVAALADEGGVRSTKLESLLSAALSDAALVEATLTSRIYRIPRGPLDAVSALVHEGRAIWYKDSDGTFFGSGTDDGNGPTVVIIFLRTGQSGALGARGFTTYTLDGDDFTAAEVYSSEPSVHGDRCLMLEGGADDFVRAGFVQPHTYTGLTPIREGWDGGVVGETGAASMSDYLTRRLYARDAADVRTLHVVAGQGESDFSELITGSPTETRLFSSLRAIKALCAHRGWVPVIGGYHLNHGENPAADNYTEPQYLAELSQWRTYLNSIADQVIGGETYSAPFMMVQLSRVATNIGVPQAMLTAHRVDPYFILHSPRYVYPYYDGVHMLAEGYVKAGEYEARAYDHWMQGRKWEPLYAQSATWDGTKVVLQYNTTVAGTEETAGPVGNLALDAALGTNPGDGNQGFSLLGGGAATITGVALGSNGTSVEITLSAEPDAGAAICYATNAITGGNLRDDDQRDKSRFDDGFLYNWACGQRIEIDLLQATELARWDPADLPSLFDQVNQWNFAGLAARTVGRVFDLGGSTYHLDQLLSARRPTYQTDNRLSRLQFDGVDDQLQTEILTAPGSHVAVIAVDIRAWTAAQATPITMRDKGDGWELKMGDASDRLFQLDGDNVTTVTGTVAQPAGPMVLTVVADEGANTLALRINGTEILSTAYTGAVQDDTTLKIMGSSFDSAWIDGDVYFAAVGTDLSSTAIARLEALATAKAGL